MNYDALLSLIRSRRSIRRFAHRPVSRDVIERLLEAARWAPSNHNRQPWRFLVIEQSERIAALADCVKQHLPGRLTALPAVASAYAHEFAHHATSFAGAPVLLVACHQRPVSVSGALLDGLRHPTLVSGEPLSVAMAVQNLLLAAHSLGLGACVLTAPLLVGDALAPLLRVPAGFDVTCCVALGYSDESPAAPRRKSLELIAEFRDPPTSSTDDEDRRGDL
jgi:nitroreductase